VFASLLQTRVGFYEESTLNFWICVKKRRRRRRSRRRRRRRRRRRYF
jgi:hypothetical protein